MNAQELLTKTGVLKLWYCEKCGVTHRNREQADFCCNRKCGCGASLKNCYTLCDTCRQVDDCRKERERFEKSEKVTEWAGWIYLDGLGRRDGYFTDLDDLKEYCEDEGVDLPKYAWTCNEIHFVNASEDSILDHILDQAYEDFDCDDLNGLDELKIALQKFNEQNQDKVSYEPNGKKALIIAPVPQEKGEK